MCVLITRDIFLAYSAEIHIGADRDYYPQKTHPWAKTSRFVDNNVKGRECMDGYTREIAKHEQVLLYFDLRGRSS
jgi:hypothetical protein